jgi:PIN domain nuclease of toxin-antitoxin system
VDVSLLLDTHLLLWALTQPQKLRPRARGLIEQHEVFVSAASIWEISIKSAIGKLEADPRLVLEALEPAGFDILPISGEHAAKVFELPALHRDPFDRLLLAQALCEPLTLLTDDTTLGQYGAYVTVL